METPHEPQFIQTTAEQARTPVVPRFSATEYVVAGLALDRATRKFVPAFADGQMPFGD